MFPLNLGQKINLRILTLRWTIETIRGNEELDPIEYHTPIPFPKALEPKPKQKEPKDEELLEIFKQVHITIPLIDAIKHIPSYAKFLKIFCTQCRTFRTITLSEDVSAAISNYKPRICKNLGNPCNSCKIGGMCFEKALLDLGASVSILPSAIYEKFSLGEFKSTSMILQLADRSSNS